MGTWHSVEQKAEQKAVKYFSKKKKKWRKDSNNIMWCIDILVHGVVFKTLSLLDFLCLYGFLSTLVDCRSERVFF